jgi:hypothetical protein
MRITARGKLNPRMLASQHRLVAVVAVMLLILLFMLLACFLCVKSMEAYYSMDDAASASYTQRTGTLFFTQKIEQANVAGAVQLRTIDGNDALVISGQGTNAGFDDWMFVDNGYLVDELVATGDEPDANNEQHIMAMQQISLGLSKSGTLTIDLVDDNGTHADISLGCLAAKDERGA